MSRRRVVLLITFSVFFALISMLWRSLGTFISPSVTKIKIVRTMSYTQADQKWKGVIVVGSGLAGLCAASELIAQDIPVHMLERFPKPGGNSIKASSGINGAPTRFQLGLDTSFYTDTIKSAGKVFEVQEWKKRREDLIAVLTNESTSAINWLVDEKGVDLSIVGTMGGHSFGRTHRGAGKIPPGASLVLTLVKWLRFSKLFVLETDCVASKVLRSGSVKGVEYKSSVTGGGGSEEIVAESKILYGPVIFASGGFAGDGGSSGMLSTYRPDLMKFPSTNSHRPGSQKLLTDVGAQLIDMEEVQVHPTAFIDPTNPMEPVKFLAAEMLRGEGGLMLFGGKRFVNELGTRKFVTDSITSLPQEGKPEDGLKQWNVQLILDEAVYERTKAHVDFYIFKNLMRKTTIADLHPSALATIATYSSYASGQVQDPLGRTSFAHWALHEPRPESVVYVGTVTPAIHFTMGGVVIDEFARVMEQDGVEGRERAIEGLWAAGEVTGGVHGENRLGGSSLLECVVFGRRAGKEAARWFLESEENC